MLRSMNDDAITVVLADDHAVVRKGLRLLLEAESGLRVKAGPAPCRTRSAWRGHTVPTS
jgi:DNA-binding NarL/FixJ family response regulator